MTPEQMADIHAKALHGQTRAWSLREFEDLLKEPHVLAVSDAQAFALGRLVADEAEILTLATHPDHRRQGFAKSVLILLEQVVMGRGGAVMFLEVASDNEAALRLYESTGYAQSGRRNRYYKRVSGGAADALILRKSLLPE